jgi:hypothetical protein
MTSIIVYGLILGLLGLATLRRPGVAFGGVICMFGLEEWAQGSNPVFLRYHALTNLAIGVFVLAGLAIQLLRRNLFSGAGLKLTFWVILLFLYAFVSVMWAPREDLSLSEWEKNWAYLVTEIILAPMLLCRMADFRDGLATIALLGTVLTFLLLYTVKWEYRYIVFAVRGDEVIHGNPLVPAQVAGCAAFSLIFLKMRRWGLLWSLLKWAIVAFCLLLMVRTGSRGQVIGAIITLAATWPVALRMKNARNYMAILLGMAFVVGICFEAYDSYWNTRENMGVGRRWEGGEIGRDISGRLDSAFILLDHWAKKPLAVFVGLGNSASFDPRIIGIYPHFVPLEILGEEGVLGFAMLLWILYLTARATRLAFKTVKDDDKLRALFGAFLAMFAYSFILSLKQGSMLGNSLLFTFAIILARFHGVIAMERGTNKLPVAGKYRRLRPAPITGEAVSKVGVSGVMS